MEDVIIRLDGVCYTYDGAERAALSDVSLDVRRGEFLAVLGRNGSGKSTLGRLMNALTMPQKGTITVDGRVASEDDPYGVREVCGMVFQNPDNQIVATVVEEDCAFGLENLGVPSAEIRERVDRALSEVGMSDRALTSPSMLSGGQKQRVAIAGVLAMKPKIIVFDEATAMLDPVGRRDIFNIARRLNREEGVTVVWITHFMEEAAAADRVAVLSGGKLCLEGTPREVFRQVDRVLELGLDVPEMMKLSKALREKGISIREDILDEEEMAVELCALR